jgi:hypothetical protein
VGGCAPGTGLSSLAQFLGAAKRLVELRQLARARSQRMAASELLVPHADVNARAVHRMMRN